jgi:hypothetical protein
VTQRSQANILKKWKAQETLHAEYLQNVARNPNYLTDLQNAVSSAEKKIEELKKLLN